MSHIIQQKLCGFDLDLIMLCVILPGSGQIILIFLRRLGFRGHRDIAFSLRVCDLHLIGQQILNKQPRDQHLLRVAFIEDTYRRPLRYHLGLFRVELRNGHDHRLELNYLVLADVHQRSIGSHPGSACSGIYGEDALAGVEEVGRIAGNLKGGEGSLFRMFRNISQKLCGSVMEEQYLSLRSGVARLLLAKHLNHHIVGRFVDKGNHDLLAVHQISSVLALGGSSVGDLPDKIPC